MALKFLGGIFQRVKKAMSDSLGLVDFTIGLVNPVLNLLAQRAIFFWRNSKSRRTVINTAHQKFVSATLKTLGLVHTSNNLLASCKTNFPLTLFLWSVVYIKQTVSIDN